MNRLLAFFVASTLATGCVVSSSPPPPCNGNNVFIAWPTFVRATATGYITTNACTTDIAGMNVYVDGGAGMSASCLNNGVSVSLASGPHTARVEAVDGQNYPILRDQVAFTLTANCGSLEVDTQPGEGVFTLAYGFTGGGSCASSAFGGSFIWYSILDQTVIPSYVITAVDGNSTNPEVFPCPGLVQFTLPGGNSLAPSSYALTDAEEVVQTGTPGVYQATGAYCPSPAQGFEVQSGVDAVLSVTIPDATALCP